MSTDVSTWPPDVGIEPYYSDDHVAIFNGDCCDVLHSVPIAGLMLTDPPYGIKEARGKNASRTNLAVAKDYGDSAWDDTPCFEGVAVGIDSAEHSIVFGGNYYKLPPSACWLVWDKDNGHNDFADCELAWTNIPGAVRKIRWRWNGMLRETPEQRWHPTQKPVGLMKWCIEQANDRGCRTDVILDPFAGSCTTAVAAKQLGRRCICIELEERYCEIGAQRCRQGVLW